MTTKQAKPHTYMRRLFLFWQAADAVLARRGEPPLTFEEAKAWLDAEVELDDLPDVRRAPWDDHYFEERLTRGALDDEASQ